MICLPVCLTLWGVDMDSFKLIVAGGRDFDDYDRMQLVLFSLGDYYLKDVAVSFVSGMARGADELGHQFAKEFNVVCDEYPADWDTYGTTTGYMHNKDLSDHADGLVAFFDGQDIQTKQLIELMKSQNKFVHVVTY